MIERRRNPRNVKEASERRNETRRSSRAEENLRQCTQRILKNLKDTIGPPIKILKRSEHLILRGEERRMEDGNVKGGPRKGIRKVQKKKIRNRRYNIKNRRLDRNLVTLQGT